MSARQETDHSICLDCDVALPNPGDDEKHRGETVEGRSRSHSTRVINPTPEERIQQRAESAVESAVERFLERLDDLRYNDELPPAAISDALKWVDLSDAWDEWMEADS